MIGSSGQNPNPNTYPASSSSSAPSGGCGGGDASLHPMASSDPRLPLLNLAALGQRMESLRRFLADPGDHRSPIAAAELRRVSAEIASAVHQIILNGAALLASSHPLDLAPLPPPDPRTNAAPIASDGPDPPPPPPSVPTAEPGPDGGGDGDSEESEIVEIDAAELLAEHIHFCEICGKGFKRDANLRMHMRAHGDRFKTLEALSGSGRTAAGAAGPAGRKPVRFSCPFPGCNRNRAHRRFRPLKSAVCVKNHFKRSHCPKMYACHRCNKKSFSVLADLKSHLKHCGETPWRCSCGTSFSRKDKLFGHLALFEGHFPAVGEEAATGKRKQIEINRKTEGPLSGGGEGFDPDFFDGLMDEFEGISEEPMNWPAR